MPRLLNSQPLTVPLFPVLVLEGADSAGKTTLAKAFIQHHDAAYLHGRVFTNALGAHRAMIRCASRLAQTRCVVIDRIWPSHLIYGRVFNNQQYEAETVGLADSLDLLKALYVMCIPSDSHSQEQDWLRDRGAGKPEAFASVRKVIQLYQQITFCKAGHQKEDTCLDFLIKYGISPIVGSRLAVYDRYQWTGVPEQAANHLIDMAIYYSKFH